MRLRMIVSTTVVFFIGFGYGSDPLSGLANGVVAALLCFVPLLIFSRFDFMKSAAGSLQTLVSVLVCMVALLSIMCIIRGNQIAGLQYDLEHHFHGSDPPVQSSPNLPEGRSRGAK